MKLKLLLLFVLFFSISYSCFSQGCVINNYAGFNRVFNRPTAVGARTFMPGNNNNYVRYEGVCGTHTYIRTLSAADGVCSVTENGTTRNGTYYPVVSTTFPSPCNVPLDDHIWWVMLLTGTVAYFYLSGNKNLCQYLSIFTNK